MKCKYCHTKLESGSTICLRCGKDNRKDDLRVLKIVSLSLVCLVMLVLLGGMVNYGVTGSFVPDWLVLTEEEKFEAALDEVVVTMGDHQMTNRQLQLYYWMAAYNDTGDANLTKDLSTQIYDEATGQTYEEYFIEKAIQDWQEIMLLSDEAKEAGFELPEDVEEMIDSLKEQLEDYVYMYSYYYGLDISTVDDLMEMTYGPGCDFKSYYDYSYHYYLGGLYWAEIVEGLEVTDQEINDYFDEHEEALKKDYAISITKDSGNMIDIRNILISVGTKEVEDENGKKTKVEDWETCLSNAQAILDEWLAGDKTAESFGELAKKHSKDESSKKEGGLYTDLHRGSLSEVDVRHVLILPEGATSSNVASQTWSDAAWAYAENKAQELLDRWLAGEKTEESFAELANDHSEDNNGNVTNGGLYRDVCLGDMVKGFEDWCFDPNRKDGDTGIVRTEYGYHIMYFVRADREADDWCFDEARVAGDAAIVKTDDGYQILYLQEAEPAWYRYSRYGAQGEKGGEMVKQMREENPLTVNEKKLVVGTLAID